ncbi:TonB-dependent receptor [Novosphingobium beihaiensis]|uniref:TonB-dependent receptor n=1 Tax=Novosphingobium beihaiensis TaxID=2930389 RepID=A0ABT0BNS5_9SPHN|nr:TonB-dependent receptor [Novosphingobium beihaiensis]MCJ2186701.1 TonB-dependent receptor [Novosphingobium beihaiensis]
MTSMFKTTIRSVSAAALAQALLFSAAPAFAEEAPADDSASEAPVIMVTGRRISEAYEAIGEGSVTNTVAVTREALLSAPAGVSGLKMLEQLPGFNVQTDGALGLYEFGNSVRVRAFSLDQIGFIVDGVPLGRSDAFGGSPVFRYVDNENLGSVTASPGSGDVSQPSYASLGPIVTYNSIEPQDDLGVFVSQSFGDDDMKRTFVRLSTGHVGPFKAYVSRTKLDSDLWRGYGTIDREHWEGQLHADLGGDSWARFKFVSNDFFDYDSPFLSLSDYNSTTPDLGGKTGRYRGYINVPDPSTPGFEPAPGEPAYSNGNYTYTYAQAINVRKDKLYSLSLHGGIASNFWVDGTAYWEDKTGYGVSPDSYSNSLGLYTAQLAAGLPVNAPKGTQFGKSGVGGDRYGITTSLHWEAGPNTLEAGIWAEVDKYHRTQQRLNTTDGSPASPQTDEVVYFRRDYHSQRDTTQLFVKDTLSLLNDALSLTVGAKALDVHYRLSGYRNYADYYIGTGPGYGPQTGSADYNDAFLPMAGLLYKLDERSQIFASYAENMAFPKGMDDIFSTTLGSSSAFVPAPKPEKAKNFELGIRTNQPEFYASLAAYYTKFDDRIQQLSTLLPGSSGATESYYQSVGGVKAYGAEFTGTYKPAFLNGLAYANLNVTYNITKYQDNLPDGTVIKDNYLPDSPKWLVTGGVTLEPASWLVANISGKYTSKRYADMENTNALAVKDYAVFSGYVDIGDGFDAGPLKAVKLRVNVDNIFDKDILSFIYPIGTNYAIYRPQSPRTFQLTISAEY